MSPNPIQAYLAQTSQESINPAFLAYIANLQTVAASAPEIASSIVSELRDQRTNLKLIASENYCSLATQLAMGNLMTDKYAEGFPGSRFYEGCDNVDAVEALACSEACKLFGAEHAYVQPHSGADANMVAFWGILQAKVQLPEMEALGIKDPGQLSMEDWNRIRQKLGNQKLLGLNLAAGGHLTHGFRQNVSGKMFEAHAYGVSEKDGLLDYDAIEAQAIEVQPLILLAGYSAYPRRVDFKRMRAIADKVGAVFMVDMAHFAGLVAGGVFEGDFNPIEHAHVVTSTTHKTLRGPRGGIVLCKKEFAEFMDKGCPFVLGGPLPHIMAAKAVAFREANQPTFRAYASQVVTNAQALASACANEGLKVVSGGTENHLLLIDVTPLGLTGRQAAAALVKCGITLNKNAIPFDKLSPMITSGLRLGTPAVTTLGMKEDSMATLASIIAYVLKNTNAGTVSSGKKAGQPSRTAYEIEDAVVAEAKARVRALLASYTLYPELDLEFLETHFAQ
jgi:glycine hydroxymethyltransferase